MDFSKYVAHCVLCLLYFHLAISINERQFQTTAERNAYLYNHSYGCTNLKELRPGERRDHREHIPKCGCGYYGVRMSDNDNRQDLYNVTVTSKGRLVRYECRQCDLCVGLKVKSVCKPKQNTKCSKVCEDPCDSFISILNICGPDKDKCPDQPTTPEPVHQPVDLPLQQPTLETATRRPSSPESNTPKPEGDSYYRSWLIIAAVVIAASIISVVLIIIAVLCNQNRMHQNSNGGSNNTSSNSLLPSTQQTHHGGAGELVWRHVFCVRWSLAQFTR